MICCSISRRREPLRRVAAQRARRRAADAAVAVDGRGLIPLTLHGGPLWKGLCYPQIGGLTFATVITLFLVPVFYSIFVLDLKIVSWQQSGTPGGDAHST